MRTLLLFRHAKSAWDDPGLSDFERVLAERGRSAAPAMGRFMEEQDLAPRLVLCSSATRARETFALAKQAAGWSVTPEHEDGLYLATPTKLLQRIRKLPDDYGSTMLVGHNPGLHTLALDLVGTGRKEDIKQLAIKYPTAALAVIDFDVRSWADIHSGEGRLRIWMTPRRLTG